MSLIKKADVKNHLSARHRTEIHVARPNSESDAISLAHEATTSEDRGLNESVATPRNIPAAGHAEAIAAVTSKSVKA